MKTLAAVAAAAAFALASPARAQTGALGFSGFIDSFFPAIAGGLSQGDTFGIGIQDITLESAEGFFVPPFSQFPDLGVVEVTSVEVVFECLLANCSPAAGETLVDAFGLASDLELQFVSSLSDPGAFAPGPVTVVFPAASGSSGTFFDVEANDEGGTITTYSLELDEAVSTGAYVAGLNLYDATLEEEITLNQEILSFDANAGSSGGVYQGLVARTESVPGPVPLLGAVGFFAWARKLRRRIKSAS